MEEQCCHQSRVPISSILQPLETVVGRHGKCNKSVRKTSGTACENCTPAFATSGLRLKFALCPRVHSTALIAIRTLRCAWRQNVEVSLVSERLALSHTHFALHLTSLCLVTAAAQQKVSFLQRVSMGISNRFLRATAHMVPSV
ncbi:hypothetical protein TRVL_07530 [Trypanosoma vivax]|nr:hypothetical protein TRVL_07530 [Trypanosoma vivax]